MKIHVLYDGEGNVIAAGLPKRLAMEMGPEFGPEPGKDQYATELEVPEELTGTKFHELGERLQVDTKSKPHKLRSKSR
jgi:hypothetical protein